jgi:hypothetical protein
MTINTQPRWFLGRGKTPVPSRWQATPVAVRVGLTVARASQGLPPQLGGYGPGSLRSSAPSSPPPPTWRGRATPRPNDGETHTRPRPQLRPKPAWQPSGGHRPSGLRPDTSALTLVR